MRKKSAFAISGIIMMSFVSCEKDDLIPDVVSSTTGFEQWNTKVDYSDPDNWLNIPSQTDKKVDAVYFYPTEYYPSETDFNLSSIDNPGMRAGAMTTFKQQASVFNYECNVFAPFYRQLDAAYALTLSDEENEELFHYAVSKDASHALDYYFEHFNNGRPFILAGHSQGSETALYLLADYFRKHPNYYKRMVAAYIIGYSVTSDFLAKYSHLKFAKAADDAGVIVSWNTEGPGNNGQHNAVLLPGAISINPINWKLDDTPAAVSENLGSLDGNLQIGEGIADAKIDLSRGSVICTTVDPAEYRIPAKSIFGPECYHIYDYGFYYANIMDNVKRRIATFMKNN
jgi:Protein of unknown function (DUF3089).